MNEAQQIKITSSARGNMKARKTTGLILGIVWAAAAAAFSFAHEDVGSSSTKISSNTAGTAAPAQSTNAAPQPAPAASVLPGKDGDNSLSLPTPLSTWSQEIQKLTRAGVDERVILTYITNSAGIFNLSPDHIIYLKDVGVSPQVINVMIQHDQALFPGARTATRVATGPLTTPIALDPAPGESQIVANDDFWDLEAANQEDGYNFPEQPEGAGPVRWPYPVKLNDPIIILKLPSFAVPYW
ncbi:MAG: hypothetical protein NT154_32750 [Verrucomicrobia bacterium]|nr:hypothetical protein [Verrucomicrobiota bacterium]